MKSIILLLCLISFAPFAAHAYKHKSEAEIAQMTPAQRVDEWVNEYVYHRFALHEQQDMLRKVVILDGLKAMPRIIEIVNEYDPTRYREGKGRRGERFDACWQMLGYIDHDVVRLRGSEEGKQALDALERAFGRMKAAGYGQPDQDKWAQDGRFFLVEMQIKDLRGINITDEGIQTTFRLEYKITLSNADLLEFSNFLTANYPQYPSWSERDFIKDYTQINEAGNPLQMYAVKKPERYYEAFLDFKKTK